MRLRKYSRPAVLDRWLPSLNRRHGRQSAVGLLIAASLGITGCGQSGSPTILNTEKVERAIEQSSLVQRNKRVQVTCPSGVHQQKGLMFTCTAVFRGGSTAFVVRELDDSGHVHYEAQ